MTKPKCMKDIAISHYLNGKKAPEISKLLCNRVSRMQVDRWIKAHQNPPRVCHQVTRGRPRAARTKRVVNFVAKRLKSKSPRKSSRTMAKDYNSSATTILRILHEDLGKRAWRKLKAPKLTKGHIAKRKTCCIWMRKHIKLESTRKMMWTDEKIYTLNGYYNPQNDVIWADDRESANDEGGFHEEKKYPEAVMVAMGITWNGLTKPYFFKKGFRLNTKRYVSVLKFYKKEGDRLFSDTNWGFQQDGASCHTSDESQSWCEKNFKWYIAKDRWPPNAPELNPMDYSVWNEIDRHVDYKKVRGRANLMRQIRKAAKKIDPTFCREVIGNFLKRVYAIEKKWRQLN
jgi:hypothetical protein